MVNSLLRIHGLVGTGLVGSVMVYGLGQPDLLQSCYKIAQSGLGWWRLWGHMVMMVV